VSAAHALSDVLWEALREHVGDDVPERPNAGPLLPLEGADRPGVPVERVFQLSARLADIAATVDLLARERPVGAPSRGHVTPTAPAGSQEPSRGVRTHHRFEIIDEYGERDRPAPFIASIEDALERFARDRLPFVVMLLELVGVERAYGAPDAERPPRLSGETEDAFMQTLHAIIADRGAALTRERHGRYWLLMPEADRLGAQTLAQRLVRAAESVHASRGAVEAVGGEATEGAGSAEGSDLTERYFAALSARSSARQSERRPAALELAVGVAVCPDDGSQAEALAAHAAAELSGVGVA
jgi:hypothetical protein